MISEKLNYILIIISDLHLSEGWNPKTKRLYRKEDFFFDLNFHRFLQHLVEKAEKDSFYKLIINGDFVDFLQITSYPDEKTIDGETITESERELGLGTSTVKTIWKLDLLMNGHKIFFNALKEFILKGNEVVIIPGNHDIEWINSKVQESFKEKLSTDVPTDQKDTFKERIKFLPWFYYDSNLSVFVEHGSQYDELNSFDYFLCPYRPYKKDGSIDLPSGSFFVRYLFNRVESYYPFADNMKPMSKFIFWALCQIKTWFSWPPRIIEFIKFFVDIIAKANPIDAKSKENLSMRQAKKIQKVAQGSELSISQVQDIKKHWVASAIHNCSKLELLKRFNSNSKLDNRYYFQKAKVIHKTLNVRYVVFGHTHEADIRLLPETPEGKISEYVNSGTWTKAFTANYEEALFKSENEFVYVNIRYNDAKKDIRMELLRWNDSIKEGERVRLLEERK